MNIICPTLEKEENATKENIADLIPLLEGKDDPFLILEKDEMTYMQTLWTPDGYDLEYQEGSVLEHYRLAEFASQEDVIWALQSYLKGEPYWKTKFQFVKKDIATARFKLVYKVGAFFGKLARFMSGN